MLIAAASDGKPIEGMKSKRAIQRHLSATYQFARHNRLAFNMMAIGPSVPEGQEVGLQHRRQARARRRRP
ncbi:MULTISPECIES: hypothetical protein [unclassified Bradyrhizobium]|uniref:hypothetical protein n=1 Tax=unclassified Bradyrhizobium TaxID=2631580 RepID=UPI0028E86BA4|nr:MULTISPECIES: hypothetical protein [unclassified Bradyrhizobium]